MKIAYVFFFSDNVTGIIKTIKEKAESFLSLNINEVDFIVLNPEKNDRDGIIQFTKYKSKLFPFNYYDYLFRRYDLIRKNTDLDHYDYIILRYPLADKSGVGFTKKYHVVTEHHSVELPQLESEFNAPCPFYVKLTKYIRLHLEKKYAHRMLDNCHGIISVTNEIKDYELNRVSKRIPAITVPNGIDVERVTFTKYKPFDGNNLDIVFVGSSNNPWHGLDRFLLSLEKYTGSVNIVLHLVGKFHPDEFRDFNLDNLKFHGIQVGSNLDTIMANMNVALNSLAFFKKRMNEACSLKIREYTARGMPFILANIDQDLEHVDPDFKFYVLFDNDNSIIDLDQIVSFVEQINSRSVEAISGYMRDYALQYMDWKIKMKTYHEFIYSLGH